MSRIVWGAAEIAKVIGRTEKQVYYLAENRLVKSIRKVGRKLVADPDALLAEIFGDDKGEAA